MSENNNDEMSMGNFLEEIEKSMKRISSGDIVKGKVISVSDSTVLVNIGFMSDGIISREELSEDPDINPRDIVKPGDEIDVYILEVNDGEGNVALSKIRAEGIKVWDEFESSLKEGSTFNVKVNEIVKGGATTNIKGVRAFIPASQISSTYVEDLKEYLGRNLVVKVIELDRDKEKVILSAKEVQKQEKELRKNELWETLRKGEKRSGVVTRLARFGAFVDLGGIDGLIHLSDMSWKRVLDPAEVVSVGDKVEVYVLDFDKAKGRISLGLKEVSSNPWNNISERYKAGDTVEGTVVRLLDFGVFVEIEDGIEGLVHISQISEERVVKPSSVLKQGDRVKVKILDINEKDQKMSLSIKDAEVKGQEDYSQYNDNKEEGLTLGDLLKDKFKGFKFEE